MKKNTRLQLILWCLYGLFAIVLGRLFYWQVWKSSSLKAIAQQQYQRTVTVEGSRGLLTTADGFLLVGNQRVYRLFIEPHNLPENKEMALRPVAEKVIAETVPPTNPTFTDQVNALLMSWLVKLSERPDAKWLALMPKINQTTHDALLALALTGVGFEEYEIRYHPEASMAAHLVGFVGKNAEGKDTGYFGVEGGLEKELQTRTLKQQLSSVLLSLPFFKAGAERTTTNGRNVTLTIRRDVQHLLEKELQRAVRQYEAKAGEITVLDPYTGAILGSATWPTYNPSTFYEYEPEVYKNPIVSNLYEPGSTFKVLTVAAGIDTGTITPDTVCPLCAGPRRIDKYEIKTWNEEYHPNISMKDALAKSDNIAMVYIAENLGSETFARYLRDFGIGSATTSDLQEDAGTLFPQKWGPVELATRSFGQGISVTSLQLIRAIASIANQGKLMQPQLVKSVYDPVTNRTIETEPVMIRQVIKPETAREVTEMMVYAAEKGEAQWTKRADLRVAGKTGTAQIANEGGYDAEKTIASFIGFAPAEDPHFVMLVKLVEPQTSPWAAETAAPTWYKVAEQLFLLLNIPRAQL